MTIFGRLHQQVIVIAHQHVGVNPPARLFAGFGQRFQNPSPIRVVFEKGAALVAARHHVVRRSGIFDAQRSGHATFKLHRQPPLVKPTLSFF